MSFISPSTIISPSIILSSPTIPSSSSSPTAISPPSIAISPPSTTSSPPSTTMSASFSSSSTISSTTDTTTTIPSSSSSSSSTSSSPSSILSTSTSSTSPTTTSASTTTSSSSTTTSTSTTSDPTTTTSTTADSTTTTTTSSDPPSTSSTPLPTLEQASFSNRTPITTLSSTLFISTTDHRGSPTRTAPSQITSTFVSTETDGLISTVTQIIVNPSLAPNNTPSRESGFFGNTAAVAAVFVLVGLAATSVALWILFAIRRRRRQFRSENDTALVASQAATTHRSLLGDDDDPHQARFSASALEISQQRSSSRLASTYFGTQVSYHDDPDHPVESFNPYTDYGYPQSMPSGPSKDDYAPARTGSPPAAITNIDRSRRLSTSGSMGSLSGQEGYIMGTHSTTPSGASYEPLMASYFRQSNSSNQLSGSPLPATPPATAITKAQPPSDHSSQPLLDDSGPTEPTEAHSVFISDDRLDPGLRQRQREADSASMKDLKDEEDYSRPVLGVRNLP